MGPGELSGNASFFRPIRNPPLVQSVAAVNRQFLVRNRSRRRLTPHRRAGHPRLLDTGKEWERRLVVGVASGDRRGDESEVGGFTGLKRDAVMEF